jgi:hypothetical protein
VLAFLALSPCPIQTWVEVGKASISTATVGKDPTYRNPRNAPISGNHSTAAAYGSPTATRGISAMSVRTSSAMMSALAITRMRYREWRT